MQHVIRRMLRERVPELVEEFELRPVVLCPRYRAQAEIRIRVAEGSLRVQRCCLLEDGRSCETECLHPGGMACTGEAAP
ncbi:MAG: hypothetical protein HY319_28800 [Armatimonadetes bacterium]|nr:hypothetical protein [Armatimonadota bacterium]